MRVIDRLPPPASRANAALYALSPTDTSWTTVWTGDPVRGAVLASDGDDLYRVGGVDISGTRRIRPELERWDPADRRWVGLTPMPSGRTDHAAVVVGRELWVMGGWAPSAAGRGAPPRTPAAPRAGRRLARRGARRRPRRGPRGLDRGGDGLAAHAFPRRGRPRRRHLDRRGHDAAGAGARGASAGPADPDPGAGARPAGARPRPRRRPGPGLRRRQPVRERAEPVVPPRPRRERLAGARLRDRAGTRQPRAGGRTGRTRASGRTGRTGTGGRTGRARAGGRTGRAGTGRGRAAHRGGSRARPDPRHRRPRRDRLAPAERHRRRAAPRRGRGRRPAAAGRGPALARLPGTGVRSQPSARPPAHLVGPGRRRVAARDRRLRPVEPRGLGRRRVRHRHRRPAARDADRRGGRRRDRRAAVAPHARVEPARRGDEHHGEGRADAPRRRRARLLPVRERRPGRPEPRRRARSGRGR